MTILDRLITRLFLRVFTFDVGVTFARMLRGKQTPEVYLIVSFNVEFTRFIRRSTMISSEVHPYQR